MSVRISLEVGHTSKTRRSDCSREVVDWRLWVRGVNGQDINAFVHKVVFHLHPSRAFVYPKRVCLEPPYEIEECGSVIDVQVHVYLKFIDESTKISVRYKRAAARSNTKSYSAESKRVYHDFTEPPELLKRALLLSGGELIVQTALKVPPSLPPKRSNNGKDIQIKTRKAMKRKYESILCKSEDSLELDIKNHLRTMSMTEDEVTLVFQLYQSYEAFEKSLDTFTLPPLSDPIYYPELPRGLQEALKSAQSVDELSLPTVTDSTCETRLACGMKKALEVAESMDVLTLPPLSDPIYEPGLTVDLEKTLKNTHSVDALLLPPLSDPIYDPGVSHDFSDTVKDS